MHIAIVLVEPARPGNVGAAARAMKTMGFSDLRLVGSEDIHRDATARAFAHASTEILDAQLEAWSEILPSLEEDPMFKKIVDSQREWAEQVAFYELMNAPDYALAYQHFFPGKLEL